MLAERGIGGERRHPPYPSSSGLSIASAAGKKEQARSGPAALAFASPPEMACSCSPSPLSPRPCSNSNTRLHLHANPRRSVVSCHCSTEGDERELPRPPQVRRREVVLRSSELATLAAIFHFSGTKPSYLGVQKSLPSLALCPATKNCVSTSEDAGDSAHYAPPWNYNPEDGRGKKQPASREEAMEELLQVVKSTKPDGFTPRIVEKKDDYVRVEYESPIMGFVDDVEFWFPPGKKSLVQYRSASRQGIFDFDINRKRIKALRLNLEKKGWASEASF